MKSLVKCSNCGNENFNDSKYCVNCGNILTEDIVIKNIICSYCGSSIPTNASKCKNCGKWVDKKNGKTMVQKSTKRLIFEIICDVISMFLLLALAAIIVFLLMGLFYSGILGVIGGIIGLFIIFFIMAVNGIVIEINRH
jgi:uncharacterized membrane protein YvbJ